MKPKTFQAEPGIAVLAATIATTMAQNNQMSRFWHRGQYDLGQLQSFECCPKWQSGRKDRGPERRQHAPVLWQSLDNPLNSELDTNFKGKSDSEKA